MSAVGYTDVVEYIAEECLDCTDSPDDLESNINSYIESLSQSVKERAAQLANEKEQDG